MTREAIESAEVSERNKRLTRVELKEIEIPLSDKQRELKESSKRLGLSDEEAHIFAQGRR